MPDTQVEPDLLHPRYGKNVCYHATLRQIPPELQRVTWRASKHRTGILYPKKVDSDLISRSLPATFTRILNFCHAFSEILRQSFPVGRPDDLVFAGRAILYFSLVPRAAGSWRRM